MLLIRGELKLNLGNSCGGVQALGTRTRTVEDGMTPVQAHFVLEHFFSLSSICIARVGNPAVGLHQGGRSEILVLVPPIRGTAGRATGAENTLVETVEFLAIFW